MHATDRSRGLGIPLLMTEKQSASSLPLQYPYCAAQWCEVCGWMFIAYPRKMARFLRP
ncbi:uncharacterized protein Dsimw501_GD28842 [Drosophila simulans]|nr:uncharacterized protein Dsimw501_GD28842 [Drosophila simulans]